MLMHNKSAGTILTMLKLLREINRADTFGCPAAFDDDRNSSFSGFSQTKHSVAIPRRATIQVVRHNNNQRSLRIKVLY